MRKPYILTHSGQMVGADMGVPTVEDIALALSRQPRFAGHTRVPYTVLDHSLFACAMAAAEYPQDFKLQLAVLLHDAHEALTADNPTPFKDKHIREIQEGLDFRISGAVTRDKSEYLFFLNSSAIKAYDTRALLAEAYVIGPPALVTIADVALHFGATPEPEDVTRLQKFMRTENDMAVKRRVFAALVEVLR